MALGLHRNFPVVGLFLFIFLRSRVRICLRRVTILRSSALFLHSPGKFFHETSNQAKPKQQKPLIRSYFPVRCSLNFAAGNVALYKFTLNTMNCDLAYKLHSWVHEHCFHLYDVNSWLPITVAARSKARNVIARSNSGVVMFVCVCSAFVLSCVW
jgi:hypothetical protein